MLTEMQFLDQGFRPETLELSGRQTALNLGFQTGKPEIDREIQRLRQVFRIETQILIVISSPGYTSPRALLVDTLTPGFNYCVLLVFSISFQLYMKHHSSVLWCFHSCTC